MIKLKGQREISNKIKEISEGVLSSAVDMMLVSLYFGLEFARAGYGRGWQVGDKAQSDLAQFNYQTLKSSLNYLRTKGFIQSLKEKDALPKITAQGKKKLSSLIPKYDSRRVWDGTIYLITYDLPVENNKERNLLREYLKKIGCGMLQQSVWITPFNPKTLIEEFVEEKGLDMGLILVSSLGKDGTIGDRNLAEILDEVYKLTEINARYQDFIEQATVSKMSRGQVIFTFLLILKDDPQLPFELLPDDWQGEKAYKLVMQVH